MESSFPPPKYPRWMQPRELCQDCEVLLTPGNRAKYLQLCNCCDTRDRDDLAWLTGTGRFGQ